MPVIKLTQYIKEVLTMRKALNKASYAGFTGASRAAASFCARKISLLEDTVIVTVSFFLIRAVFLLSTVYFSISSHRIKSRPSPNPAG